LNGASEFEQFRGILFVILPRIPFVWANMFPIAFSDTQLPVLLELARMMIWFIFLVVKFVLFLAEKFLYI